MSESFVLVPGAWHASWCWRDVTPLLEAAGHQVNALTLPGLGERASMRTSGVDIDRMIDDVIDHICSHDLSNVTLVGHSFGGVVVHGVADRLPDRLRRLVYLDALWAQDGQCVFDLIPGIRDERILQAQEFDCGFGMPAPGPEAFGVVDEPQRSWLSRKLTPHPLQSYLSPLRLEALPTNGLPSVYIACTAPEFASMHLSHEAVRAAGIPVVDLKAPHDCMVTHPDETARLILARPDGPAFLNPDRSTAKP